MTVKGGNVDRVCGGALGLSRLYFPVFSDVRVPDYQWDRHAAIITGLITGLTSASGMCPVGSVKGIKPSRES